MAWEPEDLSHDPMVNALLNIAAAIDRHAEATQSLLYGLKYGREQGMSVAEAIEVGTKAIATAVGDGIADAVARADE